MTTDIRVENDALKLLLVGLANPVVVMMESGWREVDDQHEGAHCMALYLTQFADRVGVTSELLALTDALTVLIEKRWQKVPR